MDTLAFFFFLSLITAGLLRFSVLLFDAIRSFRQRRFDGAADLDPSVLVSAPPLPGEPGKELAQSFKPAGMTVTPEELDAAKAVTKRFEDEMAKAALDGGIYRLSIPSQHSSGPLLQISENMAQVVLQFLSPTPPKT